MRPLRILTRDARRLAAGWRWRARWALGTPVPADFDDELAAVVRRVRRHTQTSAARIGSLCDSVEYVVRHRIEGALVECGVWRGGSMMAAALTLLRLGETTRDLYLFDTYTGMPKPGAVDVPSPYGNYSQHWRRERRSRWLAVPLEAVRERMESTGYPPERIHLVPGMVEETVPAQAPEQIALLRLDTDWYASTRHELEHLYPRLVSGGVLILDDYGWWKGAREAVDEFLDRTGERLLLTRMASGRIAVKP